MAYCEVEDLLIGQMAGRLPPQVVPDDFIEAASAEIDGILGFMYVTPFVMEGENTLPLQQVKLIKTTCAKLASGRIMLAATSTMEQSTIHAYAASLVSDANRTLTVIANGEVNLAAPMVDSEGNPRPDAPNPEDADPFAYIPGGSNRDSVSGVEAFERNIMQPRSPFRTTVYEDPYRPGV